MIKTALFLVNINSNCLTLCLQQFSDHLASAISRAVTPGVSEACKEAYSSLVLPGFNSLIQKVLSQFNDLYHKGTADCEYLVCRAV